MRKLYNQYLELTGLHRRQTVILLLDAIGTGALGTGLLALLAEAVKRGVQGKPGLDLVAAFIVVLLAFLWLQRNAARRMIEAGERGRERLLLRILHAYLHAPLRELERTPEHIRRVLLTRDAVLLTNAIAVWVGMLISAVTALCSIAYLVWLSPSSTVVVSVVIIVAVVAYQLILRSTFPRMREAYNLANTGLGFADDVLLGVKELKLDPAFAKHFWQHDLKTTLRSASTAAIDFKAAQHDVGLLGVVVFYGLTAMAAFGFASVLKIDPTVVVSVVLVLMFLQAHIQNIVQSLPQLADAHQAQDRIESVLGTLESSSEYQVAGSNSQPIESNWQTLRLESVSFSYAAEGHAGDFSLRNINLEIPLGKLVFIVGGNGSGKTTLAKILLGLYRPLSGRILLDDVPLDDSNLLDYRSQFCSVFSDVHLFRRAPLTDPNVDNDQLQRTLEELAVPLRLDSDDRLDVQALSQGQKKRMASALVMTDKRPLCLFDEWTADQDPEFRHYFYETFLPQLREDGRTVIVITHDDRQFHRADLLVRLDAGQVVT